MNSWQSYPKIYNLGHRAIAELLLDFVLVEEKVDGSQFSFGKFEGELKCRSKGKQLVIDAPEKLFTQAVETASELLPQLKEGWTYRAEYLAKPKHNTLAYDRIPEKHLILFDVNTGQESYLTYAEKKAEAKRLGLEIVPILYEGKVSNPEQLLKLLETISVLGGQKIEGFVLKNYNRFALDGKALMGKYVSEAFKEVHREDWKKANPSGQDIIATIAAKYKTDARRNKATQHLRERGELTGTPKDIGNLLKEISKDTKEECNLEIMEELFKWAWPKISRIILAGTPEWYKQKLMEQQFDKEKH